MGGMRTCAALLAALTACGSATIHRHRGAPLEGQIFDGDSDFVVIDDGRGGLRKVPRRDIASIDHPDLAWYVAAGVLFAGGLAVAFSDPTRDDEEGDGLTPHMAGGMLLIGSGLVAGFAGIVQSERSKRNVELRGHYVKQAWPVVETPAE
jgi:hypothetical protein